jgi:hypothetical protein
VSFHDQLFFSICNKHSSLTAKIGKKKKATGVDPIKLQNVYYIFIFYIFFAIFVPVGLTLV